MSYKELAVRLATIIAGDALSKYQSPDGIDYARLIEDYEGNWCKQAEAAAKKKRASKAKPSISTDDGFTLTAPRAKAAPPPPAACAGPWAGRSKEDIGRFMADFIGSGNYNLKYKGWTSEHPMYWREAVSALRKTMAKVDADQGTTPAAHRTVEYWELWCKDQENIAKKKQEKLEETITNYGDLQRITYQDPLYYCLLPQAKLQGFRFHKPNWQENTGEFFWTHENHGEKKLTGEWVAVLCPTPIKWNQECLQAKPDLIARLDAARNKRGLPS